MCKVGKQLKKYQEDKVFMMKDFQACHVIILAFCVSFFVTFTFNAYISDYSYSSPQKVPQIVKMCDNHENPVPGLLFFAIFFH